LIFQEECWKLRHLFLIENANKAYDIEELAISIDKSKRGKVLL
jgi:hypothetical protein